MIFKACLKTFYNNNKNSCTLSYLTIFKFELLINYLFQWQSKLKLCNSRNRFNVTQTILFRNKTHYISYLLLDHVKVLSVKPETEFEGATLFLGPWIYKKNKSEKLLKDIKFQKR